MTYPTRPARGAAALLSWGAVNVLHSLDEPLAIPASDTVCSRTLGCYWVRALAQELTSPGRAVLAVFVVLVLLVTTGWTANRHARRWDSDPRAAALEAWLHGSIDQRRLPRPDSSPGAVARFFTSLTARQQQQLAERHPLVVGNLDGAPLNLRYRANRTSLGRAIRAENRRRLSSDLTEHGRQNSLRLVHRYRSLLEDGRQILSFDPTGRGRAAEVFGDLATAERVSVVVPGADTDLLSFERTEQEREAPVGMARALYATGRHQDPTAKLAVVAWADYTTPSGIDFDAATGGLAADGADRLLRMVDGLPERTSTSLFCHSYGSVVCGLAASRLPKGKVVDIAVFGSPGVRADRAEDLNTDARVWAARDSSDWIRNVPHLEFAGLGHGADPVSDDFGARVLSADNAHGHNGYLKPGTTSLRNFGSLAVGAYDAVACADQDPLCAIGLT